MMTLGSLCPKFCLCQRQGVKRLQLRRRKRTPVLLQLLPSRNRVVCSVVVAAAATCALWFSADWTQRAVEDQLQADQQILAEALSHEVAERLEELASTLEAADLSDLPADPEAERAVIGAILLAVLIAIGLGLERKICSLVRRNGCLPDIIGVLAATTTVIIQISHTPPRKHTTSTQNN